MDYKSSGVDIDKAESLLGMVKESADSTYDKNVLSGVGGFGALYELSGYKNPVLVPSTDGVGTKILLAQLLNRFDGLGYDLVAMCVDDVICAGAKPLFFIDYVAVGKLEERAYTDIIRSIANACKFARCPLIGGETAELPGMYGEDEFDLAGFCVGAVEKDGIISRDNVGEGDSIIALASSGFHSNGYSLVRKIVEVKGLDLNRDYGFGKLGKKLLEPTIIYSPAVVEAIDKFGKNIKGISHITGGGIPGNLNRVFPSNINAKVHKSAWQIPSLFRFFIDKGGLQESEAFKTFNMGVGMALVVSQSVKDRIIDFFNSKDYLAFEIGETVKGSGIVELVD